MPSRVTPKKSQSAPSSGSPKAVDPVIAAILGIQTTSQIVHSINYTPNVAGRISKTLHRGVLYAAGGRTVTPGNGLFLTSYSTHAQGGYMYTGLRRWTFSTNGMWSTSTTTFNVNGAYGGSSGTLTAAYQVRSLMHLVGAYSVRRYESPDFQKYNRTIQEARLGIGFSPGDVPLRIW